MLFTENLETTMNFLHKNGAFLTVKDNDKVNTMTISWGNIGFEWGKPIFTVLVRQSRHTLSMLQNTMEFTISIPFNDTLNKALSVCGTKSGRNCDKIKECGIELLEGKTTKTPVISGCQAYFECKVVYKHKMEKDLIDKSIAGSYANNDYHTIFYGEIIECYEA